MYERLESSYGILLRAVLRHRKATLFASIGSTALSILLFLQVPKSFMPAVDVGSINGLIEAAQDNSYERMTAYAERVNRVLSDMPWVESHLSGVTAANIAWFHINLKADAKRPRVQVLVEQLRTRLHGISGVNISLRQGDFLSVGQNENRAQYSAALQGPDAGQVYRWAPRIQGKLTHLAELSHVTSDLRMESPRIDIQMNRDLAHAMDVEPGDIANTIYDAFGNRSIGTVLADSERRNVILEVAKDQQRDPEALRQLYIRSSTGSLVALSALASFRQTLAPSSVNHIGQFPAVTFQFDLQPGVSLDRATAAIRRASQELGLPSSMSFTFQGTAAQFQSSLRGLGLLLVLAVSVIYLVLGMLYESFRHPITIISGLPSAALGALLVLQICGETLNLYSFLGIILLIGIVKKNAIMIIDFALVAEREQGCTPEIAVVQGCLRRFRPIMMTTLAALLGAIPVALGTGVGAEARRPLGLAVLGGLLLSQVVTLFITPVFYLYLHGGRRKVAAERMQEDHLLSAV